MKCCTLGIQGLTMLVFWGSFTCQTWKCHTQHLMLHPNLQIWFLHWDAFYCWSLAYIFLTNFVSGLQMPITFTNCETHIYSPIFFLPVHVQIFVDIILWDLNKGKELTALCSWYTSGQFCFHITPDLRGILCHTSAAEPSATSVNQS